MKFLELSNFLGGLRNPNKLELSNGGGSSVFYTNLKPPKNLFQNLQKTEIANNPFYLIFYVY